MSAPEIAFEAINPSPEKLLEWVRVVFATCTPVPEPTPPRGNISDLDLAQYRSGERHTKNPDELASARKTALWQQERSRAHQVSRKRLSQLLWAWNVCVDRAADERFAKALTPLSERLSLFGVGIVPDDDRGKRALVNAWLNADDQAAASRAALEAAQ
jgi:hypothetical protein